MAAKVQNKITDAEWEVMRVVWTNKQVTSKEIISVLEDKMNWKQATIKTLIGRLVDKGLLKTEPLGNKFLYTAAVTEEESVRDVTENMLAHVCSRKVGSTIADLIDQALLSHEDVALLEDALKKKKATAVDQVKCNCTPGQCNCKHHQGWSEEIGK